MTIAVRHTGIVVKDLDKSLKFYRDLLGLKIVSRNEESGVFLDKILKLKKVQATTVKLSGSDNGSLIELLHFQFPRNLRRHSVWPQTLGLTHTAFTVKNLAAVYKKLAKARVKFTSEPQISPDGKAKVVFCQDPEGNLVELVEMLAKKII